MHENTEEGRRAWMKRAIALGGGALLTGCASVIRPRTVSLSESYLTDMIGSRFPFRNRYLQTLDVVVGAPKLSFLPQSNRLATELQVKAGERLLNRAWEGAIGISHGLRYEPSDASLRLTQLRVDRFDISGAPSAMESQLARIAQLLAEQMLNDHPVHRFKPAELRGAGVLRFVPAGIRVTHSGVAVTLQPNQVR